MRFFSFFNKLRWLEYKSRVVYILTFSILMLSLLITHQNCSKQKFSSVGGGDVCDNPPCTSACSFSGVTVITDPSSDYRTSQPITFYIDNNYYTSITWSFYKDTNANGIPDSNELIPNTPSNAQPVVSFPTVGMYIAVAHLQKATKNGSSCETMIEKLVAVTDGAGACGEPSGINGPSIAYVGDTQNFSIAKPSCFEGTVSWDLDIPRNGSPNGYEYTNVNANQPVSMVYDATDALTNNGLYTVKAVVTGVSAIYELYKDIEVRFKTCSLSGWNNPINHGQIFTAYNLTTGTCATNCESRQFRCDNGNVVALDGVSQIINYPSPQCTPVAPGSCYPSCPVAGSTYDPVDGRCECSNGQPPVNNSCQSAPAQDPQIIYSKSENGAAVTSFEYFEDNYHGRILHAGSNPRACTTADVDYQYHQAQDVGLTACDGNPMQSPWRNLSQSVDHMNWVYNAGTWRYIGVKPLLDHPILYPGKYKTCVYNPDTQKKTCVQFTITAKNPEVFFTKTDSANGPHVTSFNKSTDSYFGRALYVGKNTKGCTTASISDANLVNCNGNPESSPYWKTMPDVEWLRLGTGWKFNGTHSLQNHPYLVPGTYKTCFYSQISGKQKCVTYTITNSGGPTNPGTGTGAPTIAGCMVDTIAWDVSTQNGCISIGGCTTTNNIVFSVGNRRTPSGVNGPGDHFIMDNLDHFTYQWTVKRGTQNITCQYGSASTYMCLTSDNLPNGIYTASVVVKRISDGQTWNFNNIRAEKEVTTMINGVCPPPQ